MSMTLEDLQSRIATFLDPNPITPVEGGHSWVRRLGNINRAQQIWAEALDWRNLYKEYNALVSAPSGNTTHSLPSDFRKLAGNPIVGGLSYTDVYPYEKVNLSPTSRYTFTMGTPGSYNLIIHTESTPDSLSSLMVPYYYTPTSLTTSGAVSPIPDPEYLIAKAVGIELRSLVKDHASADKEDARAELILRNMISSENTPSFGNERRIKSQEELMGFHYGED